MPIDPTVTVSELTEVSDEALDAFHRLIPQLSSSAPPVSREALEEMVASDADRILMAYDADGTVLGSMTLVVFRIPTGVRAWIEDVVVDEAARGRGVGEVLNRTAIDLAYSLGAKTIDLTSRPSRVAANKLYQKIGFEARSTTVYRYNPDA